MSETSTESVYNCATNVTDLKSRTFIYTWKIRNFKFHLSDDQNKWLTSNTKLENGRTLWSIKLNVNYRQTPRSSSIMYAEVTFDKDVAELNDNYASYLYVYIIKSDGKDTEVFKMDNVLKKTKGYMIAISFLVLRDNILMENSKWLRNGELTIRFKFCGVTGDEVTLPQPVFFDSYVNKQPQFIGFDNIFNNKQFSDVKIVVDDKEFYVYKGILASRSPVFVAMFGHDMQENIENVVKVEDIKYDIMQEVLRFMYTGKVNSIQSIATDLLAASDKYEIEDLKLMCESILINDLKVETVTGILILADKYEAKDLKQCALEFFKLHMKEVVKNKNYKEEMRGLLNILPDIIKSLAL